VESGAGIGMGDSGGGSPPDVLVQCAGRHGHNSGDSGGDGVGEGGSGAAAAVTTMVRAWAIAVAVPFHECLVCKLLLHLRLDRGGRTQERCSVYIPQYL
jgi:hypothetical protein